MLPLEINDLKALNKVVEKLVLVNVERPLKTVEFFRIIND
jgi:hypothetical protein